MLSLGPVVKDSGQDGRLQIVRSSCRKSNEKLRTPYPDAASLALPIATIFFRSNIERPNLHSACTVSLCWCLMTLIPTSRTALQLVSCLKSLGAQQIPVRRLSFLSQQSGWSCALPCKDTLEPLNTIFQQQDRHCEHTRSLHLNATAEETIMLARTDKQRLRQDITIDKMKQTKGHKYRGSRNGYLVLDPKTLLPLTTTSLLC